MPSAATDCPVPGQSAAGSSVEAPPAESISIHQLFDRTIAALSGSDAGQLAEVLHQCSRVALPGPGKEWGLAVEKRRILTALLEATGRNLRLLQNPGITDGYGPKYGPHHDSKTHC